MINLDQALLDPSSVFKVPEEVIKCRELNKEEKVEILRHWEYDARELEVAEEENMIGTKPDMLGNVINALIKLGQRPCYDHSSPTKQGGE